MPENALLEKLLSKLWEDYYDLNPSAKKIHDLFEAQGEQVVNDHIALRTFNHPRLGIENLAGFFKAYGYQEKQDYHFKEKKLYAKHYENNDENLPKIFISELLLEKMSPFTQSAIEQFVLEIPREALHKETFLFSGRQWKASHQTYLKLAAESEYASWVYAHGFRPNHFTVSINSLRKLTDIEKLNQFIQSHGFSLNTSGGAIKGTPAEFLVQSSTMAEPVEMKFQDGTFKIPGCYYEFAKRYPMASGKLYQGFVASSADKIFESTNRL